VFKTPEVTLDVIMASACLPFLFQAVKVKGEHYWQDLRSSCDYTHRT
jgi:NTE family protein